MTEYQAAVLYIGLNILLLTVLKLNVGRARVQQKVNFGDGNSEPVQRAIRVQGNAVEDVPITLIGLLGLAVLSAPVLLIHILGGGLTVSRVLHAIGLGRSSGSSFGRGVGTLGSMLCLLGTAGACIYYAVI